MIFDHVGISVTNIEQSKRFYLKALAPLGLCRRESPTGRRILQSRHSSGRKRQRRSRLAAPVSPGLLRRICL